MRRVITLIAILVTGCYSHIAAQQIQIRIKDAKSLVPVPLAAIRLGNSGQGVIADLYGSAEIPRNVPDGFVEITALGYEPEKIAGRPDSIVLLKAKKETLREVVVKPDYDKLRRIINKAVDRRDAHNPDKYDWYRCHVYYKMVADIDPPDSTGVKDTSQNAREMKAFLDEQHLLLSETYSIRTWKRPQKLQEEVIGSRFSGFKKSMFTGLVTDMLPFHAYSDYLTLNGKDYRNPVSRGSGQWFDFNLRDELLQGKDTLWIISFFPRKHGSGLRGTVYINSGDYAISHLIANYADTMLGSSVRIEQQYAQVDGKWFPQQLNYVYRLLQRERKEGSFGITMQGASLIDSVSFAEDSRFRFDKVHTVKLALSADHLPQAAWERIRPVALDVKEARTYVMMDSLMDAVGVEKYLPYLAKLAEGKIPVGPVDVNITRLYSYNSFEGSRYGLGLQTNDRLSKYFSVGGWAGYGVSDAHWKWGGFAEAYLDRYKESSVRIAYDHDLRDPGRITLHREIDNAYLKTYFMNRADLYDAASFSLSKRLGYTTSEIEVRHERVEPQYDYTWNYEGNSASTFITNEVNLKLRYAYAERSAPFFGRYLSTGSHYPILYAKLGVGQLEIGPRQINYTQLTGAVAWQKHIARVGMERWLLEGGKSWSSEPLPIGKLFAGNGYKNDKYHLFAFGGLQTAHAYDFYTDAFVSLSWQHNFDWKLYSIKKGELLSSEPRIALVYNGLWGKLDHPEVHHSIAFKVPVDGYHEGGILLCDLARLQYLHLYYIGLNVGYFYPLNGETNTDAGNFVVGLGVSL